MARNEKLVNVNRILQKKHPTGKDVGRLAVISSVGGHSSSSKKAAQLTDEDFQELFRRMVDPDNVYDGYRKIFEWLQRTYWMASTRYQEAYSNAKFLLDKFTLCLTGEAIYTFVSCLPDIMTKKQYKEHSKEITNPFGVAILRDSDTPKKAPWIEEDTGYYYSGNLSAIRDTILNSSLENYTPAHPRYKSSIATIESDREDFLKSYRFILGYNMALELVTDTFELEELKEYKMDIDLLDNEVTAFNAVVKDCYDTIKDAHYPDEELKKQKVAVLEEVFYPIDTSQIKISEEAIEKAKANLNGFASFNNPALDVIYILTA